MTDFKTASKSPALVDILLPWLEKDSREAGAARPLTSSSPTVVKEVSDFIQDVLLFRRKWYTLSHMWADGAFPWPHVMAKILDLASSGTTNRLDAVFAKPRTTSLPDKGAVTPEDVEGRALLLALVEVHVSGDPGGGDSDESDSGTSDGPHRSETGPEPDPPYERDTLLDYGLSESSQPSSTADDFGSRAMYVGFAEPASEDEEDAGAQETPRPDVIPCHLQPRKCTTADQSIFSSPSGVFSEPLVPAICVADADNIVPLMASALRQSMVLGHGIPVVGVWYCAAEEVSRVFLGWVEAPDDEDEENEARLHIATPNFEEPKTSLGVYDLRSSSDAVAFAYFLVWVCDYAHSVQSAQADPDLERNTAAPTRKLFPPSWRMDVASVQCDMQTLQDCDPRVARWRLTVPTRMTHAIWESESSMELNANANLNKMRWPSTPRPWLFEGGLQTAVNMIVPGGVVEWIVDHSVHSLALVRAGWSHEEFPDIIDDFLAKDIFITEDAETRAGRCDTTSTDHRSPALLDSDNGFRILAILLSRMLMVSNPASELSRKTWELVTQYALRSTTSDVFLFYSGGTAIKLPRCLEYDAVLDAQKDQHGADWQRRLPHGRLYIFAIQWTSIAQGDLTTYRINHRRSTAPSEYRAIYSDFCSLTHHCMEVQRALAARFRPFLISDDHTESDADRAQWTADLRERISQYPLEGYVDAAITIKLTHFFYDIQEVVHSDAVVRGLLATFPLLSSHGNDVGGDYLRNRSPAEHPAPSNAELPPLHLPVLFVVFQDFGLSLRDATRNMQRMACVSAVRFLAVLGIHDLPVYGLTVCGPYGVPSMAWYSSVHERCFVLDRATASRRFDLTTEDGVLRYAGFLEQMKERGRKLRGLWEVAKPRFLEKIQTEEGRAALRWTASAQLDDYSLWPSMQEDLDIYCRLSGILLDT